MFFSTEVTTSFDSIREVMRAYPKWKLNIRSGNEMLFLQKAEEGDEDYLNFWNMIQNYPEDIFFNSIDEAMQKINGDKVVVHLSDKVMRQYFKANPTKNKPNTFPSKGEKRVENMIVTENSPLGPILTFGCRLLLEKGIIDILDEEWMGKVVSSESNSGGSAASVLSIGQVMMGFVLMSTGITLSLVALIVELISMYKKNAIASIRDKKLLLL